MTMPESKRALLPASELIHCVITWSIYILRPFSIYGSIEEL
jgi:hypothetical protein